MVKNLKGGKGYKSIARKSIMTQGNNIRLPEDITMELFAIVTKFYGNLCDVTTNTGLELKCHIRGKFKGKSKRNAYIVVGKIILVGLRHYESTPKNCDLLHVYEPTAHSILNSLPTHNLSNLFNILSSGGPGGGTSGDTTDDLFFGGGDDDNTPTPTDATVVSTTDATTDATTVFDDCFIDDI